MTESDRKTLELVAGRCKTVVVGIDMLTTMSKGMPQEQQDSMLRDITYHLIESLEAVKKISGARAEANA